MFFLFFFLIFPKQIHPPEMKNENEMKMKQESGRAYNKPNDKSKHSCR